MASDESTTVSLVLGSGGARGHAHIGVIRAIEERSFNIANISGCSMGAVIGGIYAAGELDTYVHWANQLQRTDVVKLLDFSFNWTSLFKGERIVSVLKDLVGDRKIEELDCKFTAVATALHEQREVWLNSGSLFEAIRASTAVPGVFAPVEKDGVTLVDGGLVNPIPIAPTLNDSTNLTIAVNLAGLTNNFRKATEKKQRQQAEQEEGYRQAITQFVTSLMSSDESSAATLDAADLLIKSVDLMQGSIARLKLAAYAPDMVIDVPRDACSFFEFHRAQEMEELGYELAERALDALEKEAHTGHRLY